MTHDASNSADLVIVTASRDRWRIGREFKAETPTSIPVVDLSDTDLERLDADPVLSLRFAQSDARNEQNSDPDPTADILRAVLVDLPATDFNKDGSPKVAALEAILGQDLTKADVTTALSGLSDEQRAVLKARLEVKDA